MAGDKTAIQTETSKKSEYEVHCELSGKQSPIEQSLLVPPLKSGGDGEKV